LQRSGWGLTLPEELEDGRNQARVHKLLSQMDLVGADRLATVALKPEELEDCRGQTGVQQLLG
jgi:hypothetical protein